MLQRMRSLAKWIWLFVIVGFIGVWGVGEVSGLLGGGGTAGTVTRGSAVAKVNGATITYDTWLRAKEQQIQQAQAQSPAPLTLDDDKRIEDATFEDLVNSVLLQQEYQKRGISVTDDEIQQAAQQQPPPQFMSNPDFQTNGQFDMDKYRRFLSSPIAREQGVLVQLEQYYREEIPREKLFEQVATQVYVTDARLWRIWQDTHDSAQVSFVRFDPDAIPDSAVHITDAEINQYFVTHEKTFGTQPGRAVVSLVSIPRTVTAADTARVLAHADSLRREIMGGTKFADVAKRESADSASAVHGGSLGWITKGQFVQEFDQAAFALKTGEVSQPVLTRFGYHLIKVDDRKDDSISVSHILLRIQQGDSSAAVSDARADSLAKAADATDNPALFTRVAKAVGLKASTVDVTEGQPLVWDGRDVPSVSAWAFTAKVGETSDLIDSPGAYYLARLDSIRPGGKPTVALLHDQIRQRLIHEKKLDMLIPKARQLSAAVAGGKTLAQAARDAGVTVQTTGMFTRATPVAGLGQATEAVGAAFGLPLGAVSEPVKSEDGVFVLHVDRRVQADKQAWQAQKKTQRDQVTQALRRQRVQEFLASLRQSADVVDHRKDIERASRAGA